jgi:hypothetical protein
MVCRVYRNTGEYGYPTLPVHTCRSCGIAAARDGEEGWGGAIGGLMIIPILQQQPRRGSVRSFRTLEQERMRQTARKNTGVKSRVPGVYFLLQRFPFNGRYI